MNLEFKCEVIKGLTALGVHPIDVLYDMNEGDGVLTARLVSKLSMATISDSILDETLWSINDEL